MARKKDTSTARTSASKDMGMDDHATGLNGGGTGKSTVKQDQPKEDKKTAAKRGPRKNAARGGQQMSLTEEEARDQKDAPQLPEPTPPAGVRSRGSSRKSAGGSKVEQDGQDEQTDPRGAAEYMPSGRSPDQKGDAPNEAKQPARRGRGKMAAKTTPASEEIDPQHETPIPGNAKRAAEKEHRQEEASIDTTAVPPPLIPGEIRTQELESPRQTETMQGDGKIHHGVSLLTDYDIHLFKEGKHFSLYKKLGAHPMKHKGRSGTLFAVWAPNAEQVAVMGDFNGWDRESHPLQVRNDESGIWEGFVPDLAPGMIYKYHIKSRYHMYHVEKSDPFAFARESPPQTASVVCDMQHEWNDHDWIQYRHDRMGHDRPYSVYEMHLGSWRRKPEDHNRPLTYRELAEELPQYLREMGFTHVEFMPVMYHPFNGSWGYQITGYFAVASQYGSPQDLMYLIDKLHQHNIGVILDWVPSHFPSDEHGLIYFDGTHLYEHADARKGFHPDWNSYIFNYGRNEVRSFLISNALFWLDKYHIDGLRVDAVASMLYLDYSRKEGEWIPNEYGGRENLEAISLFKELNHAIRTEHPQVVTIAEESTAFPGVTNKEEGLGFDMKWMMGWMHDTLNYFSRDPIYRRHHQGEITFSMVYAYSEKFLLPLSHDEVVHGKGSLMQRMPGDDWQRFANMRLLFAYMFGHPGKKLIFMGSEIAQHKEWDHDSSLDWHLLQYGPHAGMQHLIRDLNHIYMQEPALHAKDFSHEGFEWIDHRDEHNSVMSFIRKGRHDNEIILVTCNFTPVVHHHYRMGVPRAGRWEQIFTSDHSRYGGSGSLEGGSIHTMDEPMHGRDHSVELQLAPLGVSFWKYMG
jgi:1,4-alpha-glucan branching enzyme